MSKYRIYIDETGNPDLKSSNNDNHRFLSLTGVIIKLDYVDNFLHDDMENLKKRFFNYHTDNPIIFHRKEILNCINESPLKTPSSNLTTFYFKIGQLVEFDHKKDETKNIAQFLTNLNQGFKKQTATYIY